MFDRIMDNMFNGVGTGITHEGQTYLVVDRNSWKSSGGNWVEVKFVIENNGQWEVNGPAKLTDLKCLVSVTKESAVSVSSETGTSKT